jgi:putative endonuclease
MARLAGLLGVGRHRPPGERGERVAERYLRRRGYRRVARNLRNTAGEIDLVMLTPDGRTLVIVEVKTSENRASSVAPEHRVGVNKQRKLTTLAYQLRQKHAARLGGLGVRFDVVGVDLRDGQRPEVRHYEHAFEAAW